MRRNRLIAAAAAGLVLVGAAGCSEQRETERGRGDSGVRHVNQGKMDLAGEMGDGFLNFGHKCVGPTGYVTSTKGGGNAGSVADPQFMDPFCLGVYGPDGTVHREQLRRYVEYQAAIQAGNGEQAASLAEQLLANAGEILDQDPMLR